MGEGEDEEEKRAEVRAGKTTRVLKGRDSATRRAIVRLQTAKKQMTAC